MRSPHSAVGTALRAAAGLAIVLGFAVGAATCTAHAQEQARVYRIGFLGTAAPAASDRTPQGCPVKGNSNWRAITGELRERGYAQDRNLVIVCRFTEGREERAGPLVRELLGLKVDVLVVFHTPNVRAAKEATSTVPIVMYGVLDPSGRGLVASLARPGKNVTGPADDAGRQLAGKYLQLLKEAAPRTSRVAVVHYDIRPHEGVFRAELEAAAAASQVSLTFHPVREPGQLEGAFAAMNEAQADALVVLPHPFMWDQARPILDLAARHRLPAMYPGREFVVAGGLLSYDIDQLAHRRRVAFYVDRILKGARPADLPVERPTKFEFMVNLQTAKALGLTLPPSLVAQADVVIQ